MLWVLHPLVSRMHVVGTRHQKANSLLLGSLWQDLFFLG